MKNIFSLLVALAFSFCLKAQNSATVHYRATTKLQINIEGDSQADLSNLPKEHSSTKLLQATESRSMYTNIKEKAQNSEATEGDGPHVVIKMDAPDEKIYCDLKTGQKIEQRDFMDRLFLITSDLKGMHWKLTGRQKQILDYPCQEAILSDSTRNVVVWFTASLPISGGPNGLGNLPGLILEANYDDGEITIVATKIELGPIDDSVFVIPKEGKKMTRDEYNAMVVEKMKEMDDQEGGGNNVIIKIRK